MMALAGGTPSVDTQQKGRCRDWGGLSAWSCQL